MIRLPVCASFVALYGSLEAIYERDRVQCVHAGPHYSLW